MLLDVHDTSSASIDSIVLHPESPTCLHNRPNLSHPSGYIIHMKGGALRLGLPQFEYRGTSRISSHLKVFFCKMP